MMHPDHELMIRVLVLAGGAAAILELLVKMLRPAFHLLWLDLLLSTS